jgi:hypothetical protein
MEFDHREVVPAHLMQEIVAEHLKEQASQKED